LASVRCQGLGEEPGVSLLLFSVLPFLRVGILVYYTPVVQWLLLCSHRRGGCRMDKPLEQRPSPWRTQIEHLACRYTPQE
jgi:hypothetical protein